MSSRPAVTVLLYEPQDPINIGSVVRVCTNCCVNSLRLLRPAAPDAGRVLISAPHGGEFWRSHTSVHAEWETAAADQGLLFAVSGRGHHASVPVVALDDALSRAANAPNVCFVFGREDQGLPNAIAERCHGVIHLPAHHDSASYNLAQAVLIVAWESMRRFAPVDETAPRFATAAPAPGRVAAEELERFMRTVEETLDIVAFFKGTQRDNVLRTLRRVWLRADLDPRELATLWGVFVELGKAARARQG